MSNTGQSAACPLCGGESSFWFARGQERPWSAVQYVRDQLQLEVVAIATLHDLLHYLSTTRDPALAEHAARVAAYRDRYGV